MGKLQTIKKLWNNDKRQVLVAIYNKFVHLGLTNFLSDNLYLKLTYRIRFGRKLNLENPTTFNEKLQWLKINDRNPNYTTMVDKILVKEYVASLIGEEYVIKTIGVWNSFDEIDFDKLPNKFVLKCNHDSGSVVICKDKNKFDIKEARKKLTKGLYKDAYYWGREWPYKNVKRKILAEEFIESDTSDDLNDYKLMCFNGRVRCSFVCTDRYTSDGLKVTFFDPNWHTMPFERHYPRSSKKIEKPQNYNNMVNFAQKLSANIPFLRVDFYEVKGRMLFGELTFYPGSGWEEFTPDEWDEILGGWLKLNEMSSQNADARRGEI